MCRQNAPRPMGSDPGHAASRCHLKAWTGRSDRDLVHLAECLLVRAGEHRLPWSWLRLTATGLVAAEDQHGLFTLTAVPWDLPRRLPCPSDLRGEPTLVPGNALITGD